MTPEQKRCAVAGKQYEVIREFRHSNPKSPYEDTHYTVGADYKHDVHDVQLAEGGPDGHGPVIKEKASSSSSSSPADSSAKGGN